MEKKENNSGCHFIVVLLLILLNLSILIQLSLTNDLKKAINEQNDKLLMLIDIQLDIQQQTNTLHID